MKKWEYAIFPIIVLVAALGLTAFLLIAAPPWQEKWGEPISGGRLRDVGQKKHQLSIQKSAASIPKRCSKQQHSGCPKKVGREEVYQIGGLIYFRCGNGWCSRIVLASDAPHVHEWVESRFSVIATALPVPCSDANALYKYSSHTCMNESKEIPLEICEADGMLRVPQRGSR